MNKSAILKLLQNAPQNIGIVGDFCVDAYWQTSPEKSELSLETALPTTVVSSAYYSLGGASNIVANLRGIGVKLFHCFGVIGKDPFGMWLRNELSVNAPDHNETLININRDDFLTPTYCKPLIGNAEQSRIDLGNTPISDSEAELLIEKIYDFGSRLKVMIINQQIHNSLHTKRFRELFAEYVRKNPHNLTFVFDGRDYLDAYPGVIFKVNASVASSLAFGTPDRPIEDSGTTIVKRYNMPMVITHGAKGAFVFETNGNCTFIPPIRYDGPIDTVGAGDSFTAGFAYALALDADIITAAELGTCCSAITIRKLLRTGTPSAEEISALFD
jgi:D-beta-D-heptose 7-phosphate kinase/D-beta-D-heptose 1-phosphate adenosyltransferase